MNESLLENNHLKLDDQAPIVRLELNLFCSISHLILIIFGIPLNLIVVVVMLTSQRLRKKPRNILFLGISTASLFSLITIIFELIAHHHQSPLFCKLNGLGSGVAYTCFLKNLLLALLDRYLAIARPLLHRKIVTVRNVRIIQAIGAIAIFLLIKWPFIFGVVPFRCGFLLVEATTIAVHQAILILLCVVLYILVYFKTKHYARPNRVLSVSFTNQNTLEVRHDGDDNDDAQVVINTAVEIEPSSSATFIIQSSSSSSALQVHGGSRRMEIEATFTVLAGVSSLLIFSTPIIVVFFIDWSCRLILSDVEYQGPCATIIVASVPYLRELLYYHLVYNPMLYMIRSREFSSTLTEKWMRIVNRNQPNFISDAGTIRNHRRGTPTPQVPPPTLD